MPCEHCGKLFSCLNNLRTHLYYHSEPKFICDVEGCGKKFFMKKRLRSHTKAHNNQKDHVCNFCEKSYFSQVNSPFFLIKNSLKSFKSFRMTSIVTSPRSTKSCDFSVPSPTAKVASHVANTTKSTPRYIIRI